ncbi:hypothetical protein Poly51_27020 [Rubripirellula tenax]|uniref:Uncharacterized protein n=1 Tax=Rubripirellula tenax TaxID=2528015 RepID=A0A5C6F6B9_9BACT|nr:DUF4153 domain-containing protein [Rubripirellula tenax]TWU56785.1 hypothetical protein Poly51_27020 [Rubripirellula tenax]
MAGDFSQTQPAAETLASEKPSTIHPPTGREVVAAGIWTFLADVLIFRCEGFTGPALFLAAVPILFFGLFPKMLRRTSAKWTICFLAVVVARLIWSGSGLTIFSGIVLVIAISMVAAGSVPLVLEGIVLASRAFFDGALSLGRFHLSKHLGRGGKLPSGSLSVLLPMVAAGVFGSIFVFANPDLLDRVSKNLFDLGSHLVNWLTGFSVWEIPFCITALLVGVGLMRPALPMIRFGSLGTSDATVRSSSHSQWYSAFRNTLVTVIGLFVAYLGFEWMTLWKREFPAGFYYAGYAHQGAAWLTFALALATGMLSLIFRGSILNDPRLDSLRKLAWIWSGANLLLAAAVYNRLLIYVGYNGMTRMRTVGFLYHAGCRRFCIGALQDRPTEEFLVAVAITVDCVHVDRDRIQCLSRRLRCTSIQRGACVQWLFKTVCDDRGEAHRERRHIAAIGIGRLSRSHHS